jgi:hypothetical protein
MPSFYEGNPIEILAQDVSAKDYAAAYYAAQDSFSPMHKKEVKAGLCLSAAAVIASFIPLYRAHFASFWVPACGIMLALLVGILFYFVQPADIKKWAVEVYTSNALLALPEKVSIYRDSVIIENAHEQLMEYWTDFDKCIESKAAFVVFGGRERNLLIIKKQGLTEQQNNKISAHFADAFASRYQKSGR